MGIEDSDSIFDALARVDLKRDCFFGGCDPFATVVGVTVRSMMSVIGAIPRLVLLESVVMVAVELTVDFEVGAISSS